ncbi:hypothetical protein ACXVRB_07690 [Limosilactobacillus ingluviei]
MKEQIELRRELRKSWEAGILDMAKALEKRGWRLQILSQPLLMSKIFPKPKFRNTVIG